MKMNLRTLPALLLALSLLAVSAVTHAAEPVSKSRWRSVAIDGHDTVAYHEIQREPQARAEEGEKPYAVEYKGATWYFLSADHAERFAAEPEKFAPAYNGFCANALSLGEGLVKTDGTHWEILGDKLFLFYAGKGRERWMDGGWEEYKKAADEAWVALSQ